MVNEASLAVKGELQQTEQDRPQNSFVTFLQQHKEGFGEFSLLANDLREEEEGWRQSETLDQLVQRPLVIMDDVMRSSNKFQAPSAREKRRAFERAKRSVGLRVFRGRNIGLSDFLVDIPRFQSRMSEQHKLELDEALEGLNSFSNDYHGAIDSIATPFQEIRRTVFEEFRAYLQEEHSHLFDFLGFLSEKEHTATRNTIRPFLAGISQQEQEATKNGNKGIIEETGWKWSEWASSGLRDEILFPWEHNLLATISAEKLDDGMVVEKDRDVIDWVEFLVSTLKSFNPAATSDVLTEEDIAYAFAQIADVNVWPQKLKEYYVKFGRGRITAALRGIRQALVEYSLKEPLPQNGVIFDEDVLLGTRRRQQEEINIHATSVGEEKASAKEDEKAYQFGMLSRSGQVTIIQLFNEEEIREFISKQAAKFAKRDRRMEADIQAMFASIQKDPYGPGVDRLSRYKKPVNYKRLALRRLSPGKRIGLPLSHPDSSDLRVVFMVDRSEHVIIVKKRVYTHGEYAKEFDLQGGTMHN